jgi:hypothetical protein
MFIPPKSHCYKGVRSSCALPRFRLRLSLLQALIPDKLPLQPSRDRPLQVAGAPNLAIRRTQMAFIQTNDLKGKVVMPKSIWIVLVVGSTWCCNSNPPDSEQASQKTDLTLADTKAPALEPEEETRWVVFLLRTLHAREPAQLKVNSDWEYDIALLLEVASHSDKTLFDAAGDFMMGATGPWLPWEMEDVLRLVEKIKINFPHKETEKYGPYMMHPLSVKDGKLVFVGIWPGSRYGIWLNPFSSFHDAKGETTLYELDKKEWGLRDLSSFKAQMLTGRQRFELWDKFKSGYRPSIWRIETGPSPRTRRVG